MAENRLNNVFISPDDENELSRKREIPIDQKLMEKIAAGINSGDFEQGVKAYAMFDLVLKRLFLEGKDPARKK